MPRAAHALAAYLAITLVATWPLARGLGRDVPWDLGDSLLNMWILAWDVEQFRAIGMGELSRIPAFFDANIFYPAPLPLAYSEHLLAQAIQIFPVYLLTGNPILCYNLLFLSTFVLSGLGTFLLARELTGNAAAAFIAGLIFAFVPYRLAQSGHLQVLSSHWMPFALYGFTRYFETRRIGPLAGAGLALTAQNLSCGYYLLFFTPFAAAYVLWEMWRRTLFRHRPTWLALSVTGGIVIVLTAPTLVPYAELHSRAGMARTRTEVTRFSADVYSYATTIADQRVWGGVLEAFPKPEGELFPGIVPVLLGVLGLAAWRSGRDVMMPAVARDRPRRRWLAGLLAAAAIAHGVAAAITIVLRRVTIEAGPFVLRMSNVDQLLLRGAAAWTLLAAISPSARARTREFMRERGFFLAALAAALWLSLGPSPQSFGRPLGIAAPYAVLFEHVPGFDGVRVPARFAMIAFLMLAALAGYGAAVLARGRWGPYALAVLGGIFLIEATHVPFPLNTLTAASGFNTPEARVYPPRRAPAVYREVARLGPETVLVELPLGEPDFDVRATYYSIVHWRPVLNGYSGFYPPHYSRLASALSDIPRHPELSLQALRAVGATHAIVHEDAYLAPEGADTSAVLRAAGAVELFRDGGDALFQLPR